MAAGLDALLGIGGHGEDPGRGEQIASTPAGSDGLLTIDVAAIRPNPYQPRVTFSDGELDELAASIRAVGVLQPIIVRKLDAGRFELVAGERRWRAAQRAGLAAVPAIVRTLDDQGSLEQAVVENLHRSDLNVLEEAGAYRQLMDEFGFTQDEVARRVGKSRSAVANTVRLLGLPRPVQVLVRSGELSAGHARALLALEDARAQAALAQRAVAEGLSVRELEQAGRAEGQGRGGRRSSSASSGRGRSKPASWLEIERLLSDWLDTRVEVASSSGRGRVVIEFADQDDLERLAELLLSSRPAELGFTVRDEFWR